jgi:hypothetical protein
MEELKFLQVFLFYFYLLKKKKSKHAKPDSLYTTDQASQLPKKAISCITPLNNNLIPSDHEKCALSQTSTQ